MMHPWRVGEPNVSLAEMKRLLSQIEKESANMSLIVNAMKTKGGHFNDFGDDFVMLCRKHGIKQSVVAGATAVTPTAISKRYRRKLKRTDIFYSDAD